MIWELLGMVGTAVAMYVVLELIAGVRELETCSIGGSREGGRRR